MGERFMSKIPRKVDELLNELRGMSEWGHTILSFDPDHEDSKRHGIIKIYVSWDPEDYKQLTNQEIWHEMVVGKITENVNFSGNDWAFGLRKITLN